MTATKQKRKTGRPKGKKTQDLPVAESFASQCPKCRSTERTGYNRVKTMQYSGVSPDDKPFNYISWKRTACLNCGQHRIDKLYENVI